MIFRQITHDDLGCASYLIGDEQAGVAAVVDPRFEIDEYLELAQYMGVRIEHVFETHNHADHVSGHGRLAAATGAQIHINGGASNPMTTEAQNNAEMGLKPESPIAIATQRWRVRSGRIRYQPCVTESTYIAP